MCYDEKCTSILNHRKPLGLEELFNIPQLRILYINGLQIFYRLKHLILLPVFISTGCNNNFQRSKPGMLFRARHSRIQY